MTTIDSTYSEPPSGICSMTGYAQSVDGPWQLEIRSVNSRFLDLTIKMADAHRHLEVPLRQLIQHYVKRGKVEVRLAKQAPSSSADLSIPDTSEIAKLSAALNSVANQFGQHQTLAQPSTLEVFKYLTERNSATKSLGENNTVSQQLALEQMSTDQANVMTLAQQTVLHFTDSRMAEGGQLARLVSQAASAMREILANLAVHAPQWLASAQAKLNERLSLALNSQQSASNTTTIQDTPNLREEIAERLRTEVAALGLKADIAEELGRLDIHCQDVLRLMSTKQSGNQSLGKRLDFVCQELNREANTLGSKAVAIELSNASIELKLLIEQIREQAQNFE